MRRNLSLGLVKGALKVGAIRVGANLKETLGNSGADGGESVPLDRKRKGVNFRWRKESGNKEGNRQNDTPRKLKKVKAVW